MTLATALLVVLIAFITALTFLVLALCGLIRDVRDRREQLYVTRDADPLLALDVNHMVRDERIGGRG